MSTWVCERCGEIVRNAYEQVERRVEYRRVAKLARLRTWAVERLCITCALDDFERHDHPHGRSEIAQEALF
ncbi:MAG: hypothetical protein M0Z69_13490 [Actinomycetota bacterium]|nr:hypothetical protein [Actinomycetota bacterium]